MEPIKISSYTVSLLDKLNGLQAEKTLCDISLTTEDGEVSAHRLILMAASPYFEAKLSRQLSNDAEVFYFEGVSKSIVEAVLHFMYSGELVIDNDNIQRTLEFCEELKLTYVVDACKESLQNKTVQTHEDESLHDNNREMVENTGDYIGDKQTQTVSERPERKAVKRPKQNVEVETSVANKTPVKKRRATGVSDKQKQDTAKKKPVGRRKQAKPRKTYETAMKDQLAGGNTATRIRKTNKNNKKVRKKTKTARADDKDADIESANDLGEFEIVLDDDFDSDTDIETSIETKETKNQGSDGNKPIRRRKRKTDVNASGSVKKVYKRRRKRFPCTLCERVLSSHKRLVFHQFSKHGSPYDEEKYSMVPCKEEGCTYVAANRHNMDTHMRSRHGVERPHICEFCGKGFKLASVLATHINIHTGKKVWKCETCGESFNQQSGLDIHIKRHHIGESSWGELCHLCSEKFLQKSELAWHLFKSHDQPLPDRYKAYVCYICNYLTKSSQDLKRHQNAHEGIKQFTCTICQKACSTKSELKRHASFHGEKKYKCTFAGCSYACTDSIGLGKHIKLMHTHKNYKPFICPVCPYRTGVKGNLDKHIRTVHNLVVVTKHTIELKMKYSSFDSGDIITKDGRLIASAQERKALQDQYRAENPDGIDRGLEYEPELNSSMSTSPYKTSDEAVLVESSSDRNIEDYIPRVGNISPVQSSRPESQGADIKNNFMHSAGGSVDNGDMRGLTPLSNYVYLEGSPPIPSVAMPSVAEDLRISLANQVASAAAAYRVASNGLYVQSKVQYQE